MALTQNICAEKHLTILFDNKLCDIKFNLSGLFDGVKLDELCIIDAEL